MRSGVDLARSWASAGVGATAQADFDFQRNGTSIANKRFAAAVNAANFIAASETVLEQGDALSVLAPVNPDTILANISCAFVRSLWA